MAETLNLRATMQGHTDWVTCLATTIESSDIFLSGSRDKSIIVWTLGDSETYGTPRRALTGHSHYVQDITISSDGQFALSGSWDGTLRLWDLNTGTTTRRFVSHAHPFTLPSAGRFVGYASGRRNLEETLAVATEVRMALFRPPLPKAFRQVSAVLRRREPPKKGVERRGHHGGEEPRKPPPPRRPRRPRHHIGPQ